MRSVVLLGSIACAPHIDPGPIPAVEAQRPVRVLVGAPSPDTHVYLTAVAGAGSARDPIGREGLAHLVARSLVHAGAGARSASEVRSALYPTAAAFAVDVGREWVALRLVCPVEHGPLCVELFTDALVAPRFDNGDWLWLRDDAIRQLTSGPLARSEELGSEALDLLLFEGHPYGHAPLGRTGVLPTLRRAEAQAFHAAHYVRENVLVGIAGAADEALRGALEQGLARLPPTRAPELPLVAPPTSTGRALVALQLPAGSAEEGSDAGTAFHLGHPIEVGPGHPDFPALLLGTTALASDTLQVSIEPVLEEPAALRRRMQRLVVEVAPAAASEGPATLRGALEALEAWVQHGVTEEELQRARTWVAASLSLRAPDPASRLQLAVEVAAAATHSPLDMADIEDVDLEAVNDAIGRHARLEDLRIVAVSVDAEGLVASLNGASDDPFELQDTWVLPAEGVFR
ncbi:MAG: hypothetical protein KTR31_35755 [Myxococcales bacterium]|nr:hypothetical protein [Myxococcales bacterium]